MFRLRHYQADLLKYRNVKLYKYKMSLTCCCMDRVSSCNIYVIQQDTQCFMFEFIHNTWWLDMFRTSIMKHCVSCWITYILQNIMFNPMRSRVLVTLFTAVM